LRFDNKFLIDESPIDKENSIWERTVQNQMFKDLIRFGWKIDWVYEGFDCKKN